MASELQHPLDSYEPSSSSSSSPRADRSPKRKDENHTNKASSSTEKTTPTRQNLDTSGRTGGIENEEVETNDVKEHPISSSEHATKPALESPVETRENDVASVSSTQSERDEDGVYEEVKIEDMDLDEDEGIYTYECPCGDLFFITLEDLASGEEIAHCPSCSLVIRVLYDIEDFLPQKEVEPVASEQLEVEDGEEEKHRKSEVSNDIVVATRAVSAIED